jgi:hypothetical protein
VDDEEFERDLLRDRSGIPGAEAQWFALPERKRRWLMQRFRSGERDRPEFEAALADVPGASEAWSMFSVTEQREILGTISYRRFWSRRWEIRRAIRNGVLAGPAYPPPEGG